MPTISNAPMTMAAECRLTSNGDNAKTAKVSVVARSGNAIDTPWFGQVVHDFAGMTHKDRIGLDYAHDQYDNIGYLNNFDTSTGDLICSGAIIKTDGVADLLTKMANDVPYEASIQMGDDYLIQSIPEGVQVEVNGKTFEGPITVVRKWQLTAVAVCKFGMDSNTSTELQFSKSQSQKSKKGFWAHISNNKNMETQIMSQAIIEKQEQAEVKAATVEAQVEAVKAVETEVKVETPALSKSPVETAPAVVEAEKTEVELAKVIETAKAEANVEVVKAGLMTMQESRELAKSETVDPRAELKRFATEFGAEKAMGYLLTGKSFEESLASFAKDVLSENESLKKKLAAIDRGAEKPVAFSDAMKRDTPKGMVAVIKKAQPTPKT